MSWAQVRDSLAEVLTEVLNDDWRVTRLVPSAPSPPAAWPRYPKSARMHTLGDSLQYDAGITFCVGASNVDTAQETLDDVYDAVLWRQMEAAARQLDPQPWHAFAVGEIGEPYALSVARRVDEIPLIAIDLRLAVIASPPTPDP